MFSLFYFLFFFPPPRQKGREELAQHDSNPLGLSVPTPPPPHSRTHPRTPPLTPPPPCLPAVVCLSVGSPRPRWSRRSVVTAAVKLHPALPSSPLPRARQHTGSLSQWRWSAASSRPGTREICRLLRYDSYLSFSLFSPIRPGS